MTTIPTIRQAEVRRAVLVACAQLLADGHYPTGIRLKVLCPGHAEPLLTRLRDELIAEQRIDPTVLWPDWTNERIELGPFAEPIETAPVFRRPPDRRAESEARP